MTAKKTAAKKTATIDWRTVTQRYARVDRDDGRTLVLMMSGSDGDYGVAAIEGDTSTLGVFTSETMRSLTPTVICRSETISNADRLAQAYADRWFAGETRAAEAN